MDKKINIFESGVQVPTHGQWVDVPGSPFQVMTMSTDLVGVVHVRVRPSWSAYWQEFISDRQDD